MSPEGHTERAQPESSEKGAKGEKRPRATDRGFDHGSVAELGQTVFRPRATDRVHWPRARGGSLTSKRRRLRTVAKIWHGTVAKTEEWPRDRGLMGGPRCG